MGVKRSIRDSERPANAFRRAQADPGVPEIHFIDNDLTEEQLAAMYRSASCVIFYPLKWRRLWAFDI